MMQFLKTVFKIATNPATARTVEDVVQSLEKVHGDLKAIEDAHDTLASSKMAQVAKISAQVDEHNATSVVASTLRSKLAALIKH